MKYTTIAVPVVLATAAFAQADIVEIGAMQDNTLFEDSAGALSNGEGAHLFVGRNQFGNTRRTLISFDIAAAVPAGATINSVTLDMHVSQISPSLFNGATLTLHSVLQAWGEGSSDAAGAEGLGAPSAPDDATWLHTFYDGSFWDNPGGDFAALESGATDVVVTGPATWSSTGAMIADTQSWLDAPAGNFGWLIMGDEVSTGTAMRLDSLQNGTEAFRPTLTIDFSSDVPGPGGLAAMGLLLLGSRRRRR